MLVCPPDNHRTFRRWKISEKATEVKAADIVCDYLSGFYSFSIIHKYFHWEFFK